jgi:hypothetical protein
VPSARAAIADRNKTANVIAILRMNSSWARLPQLIMTLTHLASCQPADRFKSLTFERVNADSVAAMRGLFGRLRPSDGGKLFNDDVREHPW